MSRRRGSRAPGRLRGSVAPPVAPARARYRGFTFIELMVSMAITAVLVTVIYNFYYFALRGTTRGLDTLDLGRRARIVIDRVSRDLRSAKEIVRCEEDVLEFKKFIDESEDRAHINLSGETETRAIAYRRIEKRQPGEKDEVLVTVDRTEDPLIKFDWIAKDLFTAYTTDAAGRKIRFNGRVNDSAERARIFLVVIHMGLKEGRDVIDLTVAVTPRHIASTAQNAGWLGIK